MKDLKGKKKVTFDQLISFLSVFSDLPEEEVRKKVEEVKDKGFVRLICLGGPFYLLLTHEDDNLYAIRVLYENDCPLPLWGEIWSPPVFFFSS